MHPQLYTLSSAEMIYCGVVFSLQFLELMRTVPLFGFVQIDNVTISHPEEDSEGFLRIGDDHMLVYTKKSPTTYQISTYKVQRIKCWKVSTLVSFRSCVYNK